MKILITGANGFIGRNLLNILINKKYEIHVIVRNNSDISNINKNIHIFKYDNKIENLINYFTKNKFDGVVHLASQFLVTHNKTDINSLIQSNIEFGTQLLESCKTTKVKWFINTGTFWQNYQNEEYNPVNLYAATKEAFINIAKYYTETSNIIFTTIKLNDTFGKNDTRNKVFNLWNNISKDNKPLEMSNGEQIIDIAYIEDVINAFEILITHLNSKNKSSFRNKAFVVTTKERMTLKELAKTYEKVTKTKLNIIWGAKEYRQREVMIPLNNKDVIPGWKQKYTLEEAILKTLGKTP